MNSWRKNAGWMGLALALFGLLAWALSPEAIPVETSAAELGSLRVSIDEDGEVRAHDRYVVTAPSAGRLLRLALEEGDQVAAGQTLARLAPLPLSVREREEQVARVAAAEALEREAAERVRHAQADLVQAKRERARVEQLVRNGFVSPQASEQVRMDESTKANELAAARYRLQSVTADLRAARAPLLLARTGQVIELRAPVAASVLRIADKSERVVAAGAPLLTLGDPSRFEVVVDVLSSDAVKIKPGAAVLLENWGGAGSLNARVRRVEPAAVTKVSALGVEEQRVNVIADFVDGPGPLGDGYRVEARIVVAAAQSLLKVPASSLFRAGNGWALFVVERGRAWKREVEVGLRNATEAQIQRGVEVGSVVVRHPSNRLSDGSRVRSL